MKLKPIELSETNNKKAIKKRNLRVFLTGLIATTVTVGGVTALSLTVLKQKSIPPTSIVINGDNEIFSTGNVSKFYTITSDGPIGHANATDIVWEVVGALPSYLSFNVNTGELSGDVPYDAHGTFTIKASSTKYELLNTLLITVETPTIDPNEIVIDGVDEITTIGYVDEQYSVLQLPNGSNVVDNINWKILNSDGITEPSSPLFGTLYFDHTTYSSRLYGTLAEGDSGTFIIRATCDSTQYPTPHTFTSIVGEMIVRIDSQKQNPTSLQITGTDQITTSGSITEIYDLDQTPNNAITNVIDKASGLWYCNNLPSYLSFDASTRTLSGTIPNGSNDQFTINYTTTQFGQTWNITKEIEIAAPKGDPTSMTIIGNNFIDTIDVNEEYGFTQSPIADSSTYEISDAKWTLEDVSDPRITSLGLSFPHNSTGRTATLAGVVPAGVSGTITIKLTSSTFDLSDTFIITFNVPKISPTLTIHGATSSDIAPTQIDGSLTSGTISQQYSFSQDPAGSSEVFDVDDAEWTADSYIPSGLTMSSDGLLSGTINSGDDFTFNITVESASHTASTRSLGIRVFYNPKTQISTVITNVNLEELADNQPATIWNKIAILNPSLPSGVDDTIFDWFSVSTNSAELRVKTDNSTYTGSIFVNFSIIT
ncbi:MAG: hypothetical protein Ta2E_05810 [Mycoplasmoidaceae bacterium]|nr:MAG: hypothetical protein Ta2E_05810 [Mycoplasmoidaceae bacterium]